MYYDRLFAIHNYKQEAQMQSPKSNRA